jgi:hypothetical protein
MVTNETQCIRGVLDLSVSVFILSLYRHLSRHILFSSHLTSHYKHLTGLEYTHVHHVDIVDVYYKYTVVLHVLFSFQHLRHLSRYSIVLNRFTLSGFDEKLFAATQMRLCLEH